MHQLMEMCFLVNGSSCPFLGSLKIDNICYFKIQFFDLVFVQTSVIVLIHSFPIIINRGQFPLDTCNGIHNDVQRSGQGDSTRLSTVP
jgi:hypothetical protein